MSDTPRLRPQSVIELVDDAFRLYRRHFLTLIGIVALVQVPMVVLRFLLEYVLGRDAALEVIRFTSQLTTVRPGQNPLVGIPVSSYLIFFGITLGVTGFEALIVQSLIAGALANATAHSYLSKPISISTAYSFGLRRYGSLILSSLILLLMTATIFALSLGCAFVAAFLMALASMTTDISTPEALAGAVVLIGFIFIFLFGVLFFLMRFILAIQAIVLEGYGPLAGLGRSWRLIRTSFWRALAATAIALLLSFLTSLIPSYLVNYGAALISNDTAQDVLRNRALGSLVAEVGMIIGSPLFFAIYTLLYYDLLIRSEGYDIEVVAQNIMTP
jgi:hypothetical protein